MAKKSGSAARSIDEWTRIYQAAGPAEKIELAYQISTAVRKKGTPPDQVKKEIAKITGDYSLAVAVYHFKDRVTPSFVKRAVKATRSNQRGISPAHFTVLSRLENASDQEKAFAASIENGFSVSALKKYVREQFRSGAPFRPLILVNTLAARLEELNELLEEADRHDLLAAMATIKPAYRKGGATSLKTAECELGKVASKIGDAKEVMRLCREQLEQFLKKQDARSR